MSLVGNGAELAFGDLKLTRLGIAREDTAGRADLDDLGSELALAADLVAKLVWAIADPLFLFVLLKPGRKEGLVAMTAGRAN